MHHIRQRDILRSQPLLGLEMELFSTQEFSQMRLLPLPFQLPNMLSFLQPLLLDESSLVGMKFPFLSCLFFLLFLFTKLPLEEGNVLHLLFHPEDLHLPLLFKFFLLLTILLLQSLLLPLLSLCRLACSLLLCSLRGDGDSDGLSKFTFSLSTALWLCCDLDSGISFR